MPKITSTHEESRRHHILHAAARCFAQDGYDATTIDDVCREAGLSKGGLYTYFKRTAPYPGLANFDCPDSNATTISRTASNTPLQALVTLNNEIFAESAQALSNRILTSHADGDQAKLQDRKSVV